MAARTTLPDPRPPAPWNGLVIALGPDRMVLSAPGAALVVALIDLASRVDNVPLSPAVRTLRAVAAGVAAAASGQADVRSTADLPPSTRDEIGTPEAAELLGCSREHANRLARDGLLGPTRKTGNRRVLSRAHLEAYLTERNQHR